MQSDNCVIYPVRMTFTMPRMNYHARDDLFNREASWQQLGSINSPMTSTSI